LPTPLPPTPLFMVLSRKQKQDRTKRRNLAIAKRRREEELTRIASELTRLTKKAARKYNKRRGFK